MRNFRSGQISLELFARPSHFFQEIKYIVLHSLFVRVRDSIDAAQSRFSSHLSECNLRRKMKATLIDSEFFWQQIAF